MQAAVGGAGVLYPKAWSLVLAFSARPAKAVCTPDLPLNRCIRPLYAVPKGIGKKSLSDFPIFPIGCSISLNNHRRKYSFASFIAPTTVQPSQYRRRISAAATPRTLSEDLLAIGLCENAFASFVRNEKGMKMHPKVILANSRTLEKSVCTDPNLKKSHLQPDQSNYRSDAKTSSFSANPPDDDIGQSREKPQTISRPLLYTQDSGQDQSEKLLRLARPDLSEPQPADIEHQLRKTLSAIRKNR
ncbi:MAG TPA: hypothetical protein VF797_12540, partial [Noviherbaspirillum sp.]